MRKWKKLWIALLILILITPLGLWLPRLFGAGGAWGEWGGEEIRKVVGYVPEGLRKANELWKAPITGYEIRGWGPTVGYLVSGIIGVALVLVLGFIIGKVLSGRGPK